jgi:hypothetical protein
MTEQGANSSLNQFKLAVDDGSDSIYRWITDAKRLFLFLLIAIVYAYYSHKFSGYLISAMAIGGCVGAIEIMGRYRQAPLRALLSQSGFLFVCVNLAASIAAWYLMIHLHLIEKLGDKADPDSMKITGALVAGFGALVFLRSSVFKVRVNDSDVGVGPAALLDSLLLIADRGVDRWEAVARAQEVTNLVKRLNDPASVAKYLGRYGLALMQNVDQKTTDDLNAAISKILDDVETPKEIKVDIIALRLGVVLGSDALAAAAIALNDRLPKASAGSPSSQSANPSSGGGPTVDALASELRSGGVGQTPPP